jgi:hypothetical protein
MQFEKLTSPLISITRILLVASLLTIGLVSCSRTASTGVFTPVSSIANSDQPPPPTANSINPEKTPQIKQQNEQDNPGTQVPPKTPKEIPSVVEYPVTVIPLSGPITQSNAEISGMDWFGEYLILLPQYPSRFGSKDDGAVFALSKIDINSFIAGEISGPLMPIEIPLSLANIESRIVGYEGFEAIAFQGNRAYLTIEAKPNGMMGYITSGTIQSDLSALYLDTSKIVEIPPQSNVTNMSDEALLVFGNRMITLYEANGANINPSPQAHTFDSALQLREILAFPNIEYRITDATSTDEFGRFWAINYFYPGDRKLQPNLDSLTARFGKGQSHSQNTTVERLVQFQFSYEGISLTDSPPLQLQLMDGQYARNWEAIARLDDVGFLLATDKYPETIFAFVSTVQP